MEETEGRLLGSIDNMDRMRFSQSERREEGSVMLPGRKEGVSDAAKEGIEERKSQSVRETIPTSGRLFFRIHRDA